MASHFPIIIVISTLIGAFLTSLFGWFNKKWCYPIAIISTFISFISSVSILTQVINNGPIHYYLGDWQPPYGIEYVIDNLNAFIAIIVTSISFIIVIYSKKSIEQELPDKITPFYTIFLLLITGLLGIVVTGDIFNLYVFLEIASIAAYAVIAVGRGKALLAAYNYLIMGTVAACFYLLGVGYVYMVTGSLNMADLANLLPKLYHSKVILVAFAFFIIGLSIKIALFPLHIWLPDAYTYAPSPVSALIAALMTKVSIYVMIRIIFSVFGYSPTEILSLRSILLIMASCAVIIGAILAITQVDFKRMLAYSSVAQIGYIILGVALANQFAIIGALLHILNHAFMKGCLFLVAGAIIYKTGILNITEFKQLHKKMPITIAALTIAALSMIGIPPLCGFFSKWYLILGAIAAKEWLVVTVILLGTLLTAIYFFKVIENIYFQTRDVYNGGNTTIDEAPLSMLIPILIMSGAILLLGILSGEIIPILHLRDVINMQ